MESPPVCGVLLYSAVSVHYGIVQVFHCTKRRHDAGFGRDVLKLYYYPTPQRKRPTRAASTCVPASPAVASNELSRAASGPVSERRVGGCAMSRDLVAVRE